MIGTSLPEYVLIQASILALRAITPLSIFYCAFSIADPPSSAAGKCLLTYCAVEAGFWVLVYVPRSRALQAAASHPPPLEREERKELFWRCWDKIPNPEYYLSKWFLGARVQDIKRENVKDFFRWGLLNEGDRTEELKADEVELEEQKEGELEGYVDGIQTLLGRPVESGRGKAKCLRLTVDEVLVRHRPFLWYMIVGLVDSFTASCLTYNKFALYRTSLRSTFTTFPFRLANLCTRRVSPAAKISYWYRPHTSRTRLPIVFIHGIGIGLLPYTQFLAEINKYDALGPADGEIGIIALEFMPVSFRLTSPIPHKDTICHQIAAVLDAHGWDRFVLASHSYGSVITTHMLQTPYLARRIGPMLLIDPVTFLLHLPDVAYNFTARRPRRANEWQLWYFACTDMMVSHTLARHFFWAQNILWKEDVRGRNVTVSLGGRDLIVDTTTVGKYIAGVDLKSEDDGWKDGEWSGEGLEVIWNAKDDHAQVFEKKEGRRRLGNIVRKYAQSGAVGQDEEDDLP